MQNTKLSGVIDEYLRTLRMLNAPAVGCARFHLTRLLSIVGDVRAVNLSPAVLAGFMEAHPSSRSVTLEFAEWALGVGFIAFDLLEYPPFLPPAVHKLAA